MNELLQKHGCANVFTIPDGLRELMSDISREVLREQPPKVFDFIANYLSVLLITREHGILAVRVLDDLCDCRPSVAEHLFEFGVTGEQADTIANIIKEEVEGFEPTEGKETVREVHIIKRILAKVVLDEVTTAHVCQVARNAYREYWYRKKLMEQSLKVAPEEPWEIAAERTLQIYKSTKPSFSELTRATEKIQAAYRGYHVRKNILSHLKPKKKKKKGPKVTIPGPPLDIAASREIDLGPLINIKVREDEVHEMFDEHVTKNLGLSYHPQTAITHVEDTEVLGEAETGRSRAASRMIEIKSPKSLTQTSMPITESRLLEPRRSLAPSIAGEGGPRQSRASRVEPVTPRQSRLPSQAPSDHAISFSKIQPEVINDEDEVQEGEDIKEAIQGETEVVQEGEAVAAQEVPEDIPDGHTEGDGEQTESAPTTSIPTSAPETDATDVEDTVEDIATSGEEEGE